MNIGSLLKNLLVVSALVVNCSAKMMQIKEHQMHVPSKLGKIKLFHDEKGFFVRKDDKVAPIQSCDIPKELRNISNKKLKKMLGGDESLKVVTLTKERVEKILKDEGTIVLEGKAAKTFMKKLSKKMASVYLVVKQFDNGEYKLELSPRLPGGGAVGWWVGAVGAKFAVSFVGHGLIVVAATGAAALSGPAGPGMFLTVMQAGEATFGPMIESASTTAALAGGIAGGAATGPV